jgi:hypothetical protein
MSAELIEIKETLWRRLHVPEQGLWSAQVVYG